jgi:hypothetical protein
MSIVAWTNNTVSTTSTTPTLFKIAQATSGTGSIYANSTSNNITTWISTPVSVPLPYNEATIAASLRKLTVQEGQEITIKLPDGTLIDVEANGSFKIHDNDAKIIYKANRIREFNKYLNCSDLIADFVQFCGQQGVNQQEMLDMPVSLLIAWLVIEAAKADDMPEPTDIKLLPYIKTINTARCRNCGRFLTNNFKQRKIDMCGGDCLNKFICKPVKLPKQLLICQEVRL